MNAPVLPSQPNQDALRQEMLDLATSIEGGHARVVHLDEWTQWAPYKTNVVVTALRSHASLKARIQELTGALTDCVGCVAAAEAEGLHEVIAELRGFSDQTDRLIDLVERRWLWVRNYGDEALSAAGNGEVGK